MGVLGGKNVSSSVRWRSGGIEDVVSVVVGGWLATPLVHSLCYL